MGAGVDDIPETTEAAVGPVLHERESRNSPERSANRAVSFDRAA